MEGRRVDKGLITSAVAHLALLGFVVFNFASTPKFQDAAESTPVEVVSSAQLNAIMKGSRKAPQAKPVAHPKPMAHAKPAPKTPPVPLPALRPASTPKVAVAKPSPQPKPKPVPKPVDDKAMAEKLAAIAAAQHHADALKAAAAKAQAKAKAVATAKAEAAAKAEAQAKAEAVAKAEAQAKTKADAKAKAKAEAQAEAKAKAEAAKAAAAKAKAAAAAAHAKALAEAKLKAEQKKKFEKTLASAANFLKSSHDPAQDNKGRRNANDTKPAPKAKGDSRMSNAMISQLNALLAHSFNHCIPPSDQHTAYVPQVELHLNRDGTFSAPPRLMNPSSDAAEQSLGDTDVQGIAGCSPPVIPARFLPYFSQWQDIVFKVPARSDG